MFMGQMLALTKRFNEIMGSNNHEDIKSARLASLMSDMEDIYSIPMFGKERREEFEKKNPFVMQMYRAVSEARVF